MTSGEKGTQGFKKVYDEKDFLKVLNGKEIRTSVVVRRLKQLNENYSGLTNGHARKILLKLAEEGKVEKVADAEGKNVMYYWKKGEIKRKEEEEN